MMNNNWLYFLCSGIVVFTSTAIPAEPPIPILQLAEKKIDYSALPHLEGKHVVISQATVDKKNQNRPKIDMHHLTFRLHNYLIYHQGKFWCIWSEGPPIEDEPTQEVKYSTSKDGLTWTPAKSVTGTPTAPYAFIARGLWVYEGELLALVAHFKGKGAFGANKELELQAYAWNKKQKKWQFKKKLYDNAINNFPPQRLANGDWILTRRDARFNVSVLIGGQKSLTDWKSYPVVGVREVKGFRPDEPIFWPISDETLFALFRDNSGTQRLFHAISKDQGKTWTQPRITNYPNSSSKVFSLKTSRGYRVLVSNANPKLNRRELHLAISNDAKTFTHLALLKIPTSPTNKRLGTLGLKFRSGIASLQYPHVIEKDEQLYIAFSRGKKQIELFRVSLDDIDALLKNRP